jgi:hypothetical protein
MRPSTVQYYKVNDFKICYILRNDHFKDQSNQVCENAHKKTVKQWTENQGKCLVGSWRGMEMDLTDHGGQKL